MKKSIATLLCIAILASAASCAPKEKPVPEDSSNTSVTESDAESSEETGSEPTVSGDTISDPNSNNTPGGPGSTSSKTNSVITPPKDKTLVNNCYNIDFPIAKDKVTFNIMIKDHAAGLANYKDTAFQKYIEEKTNIKLVFEKVSAGAVTDKMSVVYASGSMPDMFWGMAPAMSFHIPYIKQKKILALDSYIKDYGSNIQKMFQEVPAAKYLTTESDGKTYMLPMVSDYDNYSYKLFINKTWLTKVGESMPTTTDQLKNVLIKFKQQDANGNGNKNDEIPITFAGDVPPSLFGPFGISTYLNWVNINQSNNQIEYSPMTEGYRQGLSYISDLYKEKLLDQNFRGNTPAKIKAQTSAAVPTVGVFSSSSGYSEGVSTENFMKHYALMPPLKGPAGAASTWSYVDTEKIWAEWFLVTKQCKYPEIAVRLADYLYSQEGTAVALYGPPSKTGPWNYGANNTFVPNYANIPAKKTFSEWIYSTTPGYPIPHYSSKAYYEWSESYRSSNPTLEEKASTVYENSLNVMFKSVKPTYVLPKLSLTDQEAKEVQKLGNYQKYALEMRFNFISGSANLDTDWNGYVQALKKLGAGNMLKIEQQAYNRYRVAMSKK